MITCKYPLIYHMITQTESSCRVNTNLSVDALSGHTLSADAVAGAVHSRSLHPAAAQRKLLQPLRVSCIASFCRTDLIIFEATVHFTLREINNTTLKVCYSYCT